MLDRDNKPNVLGSDNKPNVMDRDCKSNMCDNESTVALHLALGSHCSGARVQCVI